MKDKKPLCFRGVSSTNFSYGTYVYIFVCIRSDVYNTKSAGRFGPVLYGLHLARTGDHFNFGQFSHRDNHWLFGRFGKVFKAKKKIFSIGESKSTGCQPQKPFVSGYKFINFI